MKTNRKPPLARSPMHLRTRRALQPSNINTPLRTPSATFTKPEMKASEINRKISCELSALSKMVQVELGAMNAKNSTTSTPILGSAFERGRFYDEYTARRNERLRKKQIESIEVIEPKMVYNLGVKLETAKKKDIRKKTESLKKSVAVSYSVDRSQHSRYALRSTVKKPPLPVPMNVEEKMTMTRAAASRSRRNKG
ncbi:hypothetical protein RND81_03G014900 [Saponaria officinalis]|uniref:Uncharacterized protein n=1 Tax=Saponaria officinalis TaxID=3572 RepID=A0AAW1M3H8_SAPOF